MKVNYLKRIFIWKLFFRSCAALLSVTALAKFASAFGTSRALSDSDKIIAFLSNSQLMVVVAIVEMVVVVYMMLSRSISKQAAALVCLCTAMWAYRVSLFVGGFPPVCKCLGGLVETIYMSDSQAIAISTAILCYMTVGGTLALSYLHSSTNPARDEPRKSASIPSV